MSKTYFVTRHLGAIEWANQQGIKVDYSLAHMDNQVLVNIGQGDRVLGILPVQMIAQLCAQGARYFHLEVLVSSEMRGKELSADQLTQARAKLIEYSANKH